MFSDCAFPPPGNCFWYILRKPHNSLVDKQILNCFPAPALFRLVARGTSLSLALLSNRTKLKIKTAVPVASGKVANNWRGFKIQRYNPPCMEEEGGVAKNEVNGTE